MMMSDVCLSVAYIGPKSRTERPRETKIGTVVAHVTRDSDTTFKVKGQRSRSPGRFTHRRVGASGSCSGGRGNVMAVRNCCYVAVCSAARGASAPMGEERGGAYRGGRPPTACSLSVHRRQRLMLYKPKRHCCAAVWLFALLLLMWFTVNESTAQARLSNWVLKS